MCEEEGVCVCVCGGGGSGGGVRVRMCVEISISKCISECICSVSTLQSRKSLI